MAANADEPGVEKGENPSEVVSEIQEAELKRVVSFHCRKGVLVNADGDGARFSGKALVVEDNKNDQYLMRILLERAGLDVDVACDGRQGVDKAVKGGYDVIMLDMQMPEMDGYEAAKMLRDKGIGVPIIAVTAYAMKDDDEKCIAAGCDGYLAKPVRRQEILEMVGKYLSKASTDGMATLDEG